jgi:two-component system response regulator FixJ
MDAKRGTVSAGQLTAIVVDDDEHLLEALRFSLELDGLRVITHRSADTVLPDRLPTRDACLVLDYRLPTANGLDLLGRLIADGIDLPAILVTSHASGEVRARARAMGATLIEKPLLGDTLVTAIRAALRR